MWSLSHIQEKCSLLDIQLRLQPSCLPTAISLYLEILHKLVVYMRHVIRESVAVLYELSARYKYYNVARTELYSGIDMHVKSCNFEIVSLSQVAMEKNSGIVSK